MSVPKESFMHDVEMALSSIVTFNTNLQDALFLQTQPEAKFQDIASPAI
jgi:hypothetical protein